MSWSVLVMIGLFIVYQVAVGVFVRVVHSRRMHMLHRVRKGSGINAPPQADYITSGGRRK